VSKKTNVFVLQRKIGIDNVYAVLNETSNYVRLISISLETVITLLGDFNILKICMLFCIEFETTKQES